MSLRARGVAGLRWIGAAHLLRSLISVVTLVVIARWVAPEAFGVFAMAVAVYVLLGLLAELGLDSAVIQHPNPDAEAIAGAFEAVMIASIFLSLSTVLAAPLVAWLYREPAVSPVLIALALAVPVEQLRRLPQALIERRLDYRPLAWMEVAATATGAAAGIGAAVAGLGVWSLVAQVWVNTLLLTGLVLAFGDWRGGPWRPGAWRLGAWRLGLARFFAFGRRVTLARLADHLARYLDQILVGRALGGESLGYYGIAVQIMLFPLLAMARLIARVLFPTASRAEAARIPLAEGFLDVAVAVTVLAAPLMLGLVAVAEPFVLLLFGETWRPLVLLVSALAPLGILLAVTQLGDAVFLAKGRADLKLRWSLARAVGIVVAVLTGLNWGLLGVAIAYAAIGLVLETALLLSLSGVIGLPRQRLLSALGRPLAAAAVMALCAHLTAEVAAVPAEALALAVPLGVLIYTPAIAWLEGARLKRLAFELLGR